MTAVRSKKTQNSPAGAPAGAMSSDMRDDNRQLAPARPTRLPWDSRIAKEYPDLGVNAGNWRFLCEVLYPKATSVQSIGLVLQYCQARKLDVFKRPVHIVPVYDSESGRQVDTVWPGIADLRTTATRTGAYAGKDRVEYGPLMTVTFEGEENVYDGKRKTGKRKVSKAVTFPEYAQLTVYRLVQGQRVAFHCDPVFWLETYARKSRWNDVPNEMWERRSRGQLAKCAEAAALRQAFPEELGNEYAFEEMEGQLIGHNGPPEPIEAEPKKTMTLTGGVDAGPAPSESGGSGDSDGVDADGVVQDADFEESPADDGDSRPDPESESPDAFADWRDLVESVEQAVEGEMPGFRRESIAPHLDILRRIRESDADEDLRRRAQALCKINSDETRAAEAAATRKESKS